MTSVSRDAVEAYTTLCGLHSTKPNATILSAWKGQTLDTIRSIDLSNGYYGFKQALVLVKLVPDCPFLESINLSGNSITSGVVEDLCSALARGIVHRVDLSNNPMDICSGQRLLETLRSNMAITECRVNDCLLPDYVVHDISVQAELNELLFRKRDAEKRNLAPPPVPQCLLDYLFDELSNADDIEALSSLPVDFDCDGDHDTTVDERKLVGAEDPSQGEVPFLLRGIPAGVLGSPLDVAQAVSLAMTTATAFEDHVFDLDKAQRCYAANVLQTPSASISCAPIVRWMRFSHFCEQRSISPTCNGASTLISGQLRGARWVECAMNIVREIEPLRKASCVRALPDLGIYHFTFFKGDAKVDILVDDVVPVLESGEGGVLTLACLHHEDPSDAWAALYEKAYAKLHGGYQNLLGGSTRYALEDFTGGVCCKSSWTISAVRMHRDHLFRMFRDHIIHNRVVALKSTALTELERKSQAAAGIVSNRTYLLKNTVSLCDGRTFLVQLSSPTSNVTWNGKFCNGSVELSGTADIQEAVGHPCDFWMLLEDAVSMFDSCYVLWHVGLLDLSLRSIVLRDTTTAPVSSAYGTGGWPSNPAFLLQTEAREALVVIRILQRDARITSSVNHSGVQAHVHKQRPPSKTTQSFLNDAQNLVCRSSAEFVFGREVVLPVTVRRHQPLQLTVSASGSAVPFQVVATATRNQFSLTPMAPPLVVALKGQWHGLQAAGRFHQKSGIVDSCQFTVTLAEDSLADGAQHEVTIWLDQGANTRYTLGIVGHYCPDRIRDASQLDASLEVPFVQQPAIGCTLLLSKTQPCCTMIPMTWNAGEEGSFVLTCYSSSAKLGMAARNPH